MPLNPGQTLNNRYRVVRLLGQGGFGAVYRAWDTTLNIPCAVKESFDLTPEGQRQFLREAQILAGLHHPNLPRVTDFFTVSGQGQYLVMDYVEGEDLNEKLEKAGGAMAETLVLPWITQVLEALDYLHRQNPPIIHRDIKPANIKITPSGQAMLVDFGIAKTYDPSLKTTMGARAVTPGYSPLEQYGRGITDNRTDLYSLGATLYTLLTGEEPPEAPQRAVRDPLVPPRQLSPAVTPTMEAALLKSLQMDPALRFQRAGEFWAVISGQLPTASNQLPGASSQLPVATASPQVVAQPRPRLSMGKGIAIGVSLLVGLVLFALVGGWVLSETRAARLTQTAQELLSLTEEVIAIIPTPPPSPMPTYAASGVVLPDITNVDEAMAYLVSQTTHFKGDSDAPVTMILFSDFQ